ncbi:MAG: 50S ribosomal protein L11 methyltransferase [Candidatus Binatia bacterium]
MQKRWFEIALPVPADLVDEAAALLDFAGFGGVEVRESASGTDVVVVVETTDDNAALQMETAREAVAILGPGQPKVTELDPKVWTENWKRHFARRTFAGRIEVRPPWEEPSPEAGADGLVSIVINPGMAFGTGLHETTAGCLELLVEEVRPGMRVADVGCGSGILAIAAARLGAAEVLATDVDPLAVEATRENIEANGVAAIVRAELEPGEVGVPEWEDGPRPGLSQARSDERSAVAAFQQPPVDKPASTEEATPNGATSGGFLERGPAAFDLVVANILAETLVEMRHALTSALRPGGTLVLSGIEVRRLKMVEEAFIGPCLRLGKVLPKGDWVSLALHHQDLAGTRHGTSAVAGTEEAGRAGGPAEGSSRKR